MYTYEEMPVVPLCDVHPAFGKVTTLNREKTIENKKKKVLILVPYIRC